MITSPWSTSKAIDPNAVLLVDDAIVIELLHHDRSTLRRQLLVLDANLDVGGVGLLQMRHEVLGAGRPDHAEGFRARAEMGLQPARKPQIGNADGMVRVIVRE